MGRRVQNGKEGGINQKESEEGKREQQHGRDRRKREKRNKEGIEERRTEQKGGSGQ